MQPLLSCQSHSPVQVLPVNSILTLFRIHLIGLPFTEVSIIGYQQSDADEREDDGERNVFSFQFDVFRFCSNALRSARPHYRDNGCTGNACLQL